MTIDQRDAIIDVLARVMPPVMRWAGALAKTLRRFDISLEGKSSGNANTDALTLADLTIQELLVGAMRDADPILRTCRIEAEEETGDLAIFSPTGSLVISLDPIDGTKQFRDRSGNGYAVMLHVRDRATVHYSLIYLPESVHAGATVPGEWVEVRDMQVKCGPDDTSRPAEQVLARLEPWNNRRQTNATGIYLIGFQQRDVACAEAVTARGLHGVAPDAMPGSIYPLMATGAFAGSLIHSPNVYDFPVSLHIARSYGGDSVWAHSGEAVHFEETWLDDRADMLRLPGIVATSADPAVRQTLCDLARDWNPRRYND